MYSKPARNWTDCESLTHADLKVKASSFSEFKFIFIFSGSEMSVHLYGSLTRQLFSVWSCRAERTNTLSENAIPFALHDMEIFPSASQVHEMLHCASECSKRNTREYITFGEFCVFASELKTCYEKKIPKPTPLSRTRKEGRRAHSRLKTLNATNKPNPKYEVFLGGSCNPTTWRRDIAIPFLKSQAISSYNPQVAHWGPELIELENLAKQNAEVLFFVIDNQTRSIASMIEASHIAGTKRKLMLVMYNIDDETTIFGEKLTQKEAKDLRKGHRYLRDIVERENIPVFNNINEALKGTVRVVKDGIRPQELTMNDAQHPVKMAHIQLAEKLFKLREVFDDLDLNNSGFISLEDVCMAYKILTSQELSTTNLKNIIESTYGESRELKVNLDDVRIDFDQFCCIMTEFSICDDGNGNTSNLINSVASKVVKVITSVAYPFSKLVDWFLQPNNEESLCNGNCETPPPLISFTCQYRHLYLGGSGRPSRWRDEIAMPILKKKGLTCYTSSFDDSPWQDRLSPLEIATVDRCKVLLFVITADTRALSEMILAVHYIGKECNVVLCIQYLPDDVVIDGEKLSEQAVKDYNRGRVYLSDIATRNGVPVFDKIDEAVKCAAEKSTCDN